ncbi:hypothetical protein BaRGS_00030105, partial [Batillaria attramentaria]
MSVCLCVRDTQKEAVNSHFSERDVPLLSVNRFQKQKMAYPAVVTKQPEGMAGMTVNQRMWSSGTFACFDDMGSCLLGAICPIILAHRLAGDLGESACVPCCVPGALITMRTKLRTMQNIQGSIMDDCIMAQCCGPCILCQMVREMDYIKRHTQLNPLPPLHLLTVSLQLAQPDPPVAILAILLELRWQACVATLDRGNSAFRYVVVGRMVKYQRLAVSEGRASATFSVLTL